MKTLVIDASVVIKWVVTETGSQDALLLRKGRRLVAPELLAAECANILWKKVQRGLLTNKEAALAAELLERADVELLPMRGLIRRATDLAIHLSHPAYDCMYLTLALANGWTFVTADERLVRKIRERLAETLPSAIQTMTEAASDL